MKWPKKNEFFISSLLLLFLIFGSEAAFLVRILAWAPLGRHGGVRTVESVHSI